MTFKRLSNDFRMTFWDFLVTFWDFLVSFYCQKQQQQKKPICERCTRLCERYSWKGTLWKVFFCTPNSYTAAHGVASAHAHKHLQKPFSDSVQPHASEKCLQPIIGNLYFSVPESVSVVLVVVSMLPVVASVVVVVAQPLLRPGKPPPGAPRPPPGPQRQTPGPKNTGCQL